MRQLKTPEEIIEEAWGNYSNTQDKMIGVIVAAQRDALECIDDMTIKFEALMSKLATNELALSEFTEAWKALGSYIKMRLENLMPKEK